MNRLMACSLLWLTSGCSLVLTQSPPEAAPARTEVRCTESKLTVALDMVATAAALLFALDAFVASQQLSCDSWWCIEEGHRSAAGVGALFVAIGFGVSAGIGDGRVDRCRGHNSTARLQASEDVLR